MSHKLNTEKLSIIDFRLVNAKISTPEAFEISEIKGYDLKTELKFGYNLKDKIVKADFNISIKALSKSDIETEATLDYDLVYFYLVENIEELVFDVKDQGLKIDSGLGNALSSVTYSTSRGVLMTRLQGTVFQDFVLPIINPNSLLKSDN